MARLDPLPRLTDRWLRLRAQENRTDFEAGRMLQIEQCIGWTTGVDDVATVRRSLEALYVERSR